MPNTLFGAILGGFGQAAHENQKTLLDMQHQDRMANARIFEQLANNPNFTPEQQAWFTRGAFAHLASGHDPKLAKQFEIDPKTNTIKIPVSIMTKTQPPTPPPIGIPESPGSSGPGMCSR